MVDAVGDRLPDVDVHPRHQCGALADLSQHLVFVALTHGQLDVDLGRFHSLEVLVEFGPAGSTSGGNHLGYAQENLFQSGPKAVGLSQTRARNRNRADG